MRFFVNRRLGQSLLIGEDLEVTVRHIETAEVELTLTDLWTAPARATWLRRLPLNEAVEVMPGVRLVFLKSLNDGQAIRLRLEVPSGKSIHRKERKTP